MPLFFQCPMNRVCHRIIYRESEFVYNLLSCIAESIALLYHIHKLRTCTNNKLRIHIDNSFVLFFLICFFDFFSHDYYGYLLGITSHSNQIRIFQQFLKMILELSRALPDRLPHVPFLFYRLSQKAF